MVSVLGWAVGPSVLPRKLWLWAARKPQQFTKWQNMLVALESQLSLMEASALSDK